MNLRSILLASQSGSDQKGFLGSQKLQSETGSWEEIRLGPTLRSENKSDDKFRNRLFTGTNPHKSLLSQRKVEHLLYNNYWSCAHYQQTWNFLFVNNHQICWMAWVVRNIETSTIQVTSRRDGNVAEARAGTAGGGPPEVSVTFAESFSQKDIHPQHMHTHQHILSRTHEILLKTCWIHQCSLSLPKNCKTAEM